VKGARCTYDREQVWIRALGKQGGEYRESAECCGGCG